MSVFLDMPRSRWVAHNELAFAISDGFPVGPGHTLVIPKERKAFLHQLSEETGAAIGRALPRLASAVMDATGATAYNILQNNGASAHQAVFHVHFHIIPKIGGQGLGIGWQPSGLDAGNAAVLLNKLHKALNT